MVKTAYVAAPWGEKAAGRRLRNELARRGVICTASWLDRPDEEYYCNAPEAIVDESDLRRAQLLVMYVPEDDTSRGGRETELGMAIALRRPVHLIGKPKQVFHAHPAVAVFPTIEAWEAAKW